MQFAPQDERRVGGCGQEMANCLDRSYSSAIASATPAAFDGLYCGVSALFGLCASSLSSFMPPPQPQALAFRSQRQVEAELDDMRSCMDGQPPWPQKRREPWAMEPLSRPTLQAGCTLHVRRVGVKEEPRWKPLSRVSPRSCQQRVTCSDLSTGQQLSARPGRRGLAWLDEAGYPDPDPAKGQLPGRLQRIAAYWAERIRSSVSAARAVPPALPTLLGSAAGLALDVLTSCSVRAQKSRSPRSRSKGRREASYGAALCLCLLWRGVAREADVLCSVRGWSVPPALVTRTRIYQDLPHENTKQSLREATQRYTLVSRSVRWTAVTISKHPADMQLS